MDDEQSLLYLERQMVERVSLTSGIDLNEIMQVVWLLRFLAEGGGSDWMCNWQRKGKGKFRNMFAKGEQ